MQDDEARNVLAYCLSFSNDENDFARNFAQLDERMKQQLAFSTTQQQQQQSSKQATTKIDVAPLPKTLVDALLTQKSRAIVITEAKKPFRIVSVNQCWEQLCGYSFVESQGATLGSLLQGPDTDTTAATNLIVKLLQGEAEAGVTLTNYTKSGRRFRNRVRVGPLHDDYNNTVPYFVGVLQEVRDGM